MIEWLMNSLHITEWLHEADPWVMAILYAVVVAGGIAWMWMRWERR